MVKRTDPKTGRKYEASSRKGKQIWEEMKKKKARAQKRAAKQKKAKPKCINGKCANKCGGRTANTSQMAKLTPLKSVKNGGVRLSASWYFNTACRGNLKKCEPQMVLQPSGLYVLKKIRIVNGKSGPEPRWVKA